MEYFTFLDRIIDDGIEQVGKDYDSVSHGNERQGAMAGFHACRGQRPPELLKVWEESQEYVNSAFSYKDTAEYWWFRCYQMEIEFVMNVVSAVMVNQGHAPILSHFPTYRGVMRAASILNSEV